MYTVGMATATRNHKLHSKRLTTSVYIRRDYHAKLEEMAVEEAERTTTEKVGVGRLIEQALEPFFLARGIAIGGTPTTSKER